MFKKSDLRSLISSDGQHLLNHLEYANKFNQFIQLPENQNYAKCKKDINLLKLYIKIY
jgi:hypothetical protein